MRRHLHLQGNDFTLTLVAEDKAIDEVDLEVHARMLGTIWNRRRRARLCKNHSWGEEFTLEPAVYGPDVKNSFCLSCGIDRISWDTQVIEENLSGVDAGADTQNTASD